MRRGVALFFAAMLTACAPKHDAAAPSPTAAALPAPTPDDAVVRIGVAQSGQTIAVPVGRRFAIELVGVPTAGYVWEPVTLPPFVTRAGEAGGPTSAAQAQPGFTGGNHWEVFLFVAQAPGEGIVRLEQRRPWETAEPPAQTFTVTIAAQ